MIFLIALFLIKKTTIFKKSTTPVVNNQENGLATMTLEELVYKDADSDGIPDWQEGLYGLDPTKKETTPGIPDSVAINKLKSEQGSSAETINESRDNQETENLTQTEKFSVS